MTLSSPTPPAPPASKRAGATTFFAATALAAALSASGGPAAAQAVDEETLRDPAFLSAAMFLGLIAGDAPDTAAAMGATVEDGEAMAAARINICTTATAARRMSAAERAEALGRIGEAMSDGTVPPGALMERALAEELRAILQDTGRAAVERGDFDLVRVEEDCIRLDEIRVVTQADGSEEKSNDACARAQSEWGRFLKQCQSEIPELNLRCPGFGPAAQAMFEACYGDLAG